MSRIDDSDLAAITGGAGRFPAEPGALQLAKKMGINRAGYERLRDLVVPGAKGDGVTHGLLLKLRAEGVKTIDSVESIAKEWIARSKR